MDSRLATFRTTFYSFTTPRMGLTSLFQRQSKVPPPATGGDAAQAVEAARTSARRRLIGAVVLLGVGVIAFPLLFETQPRPIPVDIAIEIPRQAGAPALTVPAPRPVDRVVDAEPPAAPAVPVISEEKPEADKVVASPTPAAAKAVPQATAKSTPVVATPEPAPAAKTNAEAGLRFIVQVGAFADANGAREARAKVGKLGLRTYTQNITTAGGKRIRVRLGPFDSRSEAENAAAKVKAAGLPAAVMTL